MPEVKPFGLRFGEAIDYLKGKLPESTLKWDDLAGPVHGKVFAIAGATSVDLVADIQKSLAEALQNGTTITQFRKDFDAAVQKHGWEYRGKRGWRTSVIFDTNMRTAHMAGRWQQLQANKTRRPFLQYRTAGDARVRPMHRMWNGLIYPIDHSFWQTHYPPNGWGCRCTVRAYSQADLDAGNLAVSDDVEMKTREVVSRDGEIKDRVPVGIDPGWDHNVGQSWISPEVALGQKLARLPMPLRGLMVDKTISPAYQKVLSDDFKGFRENAKASLKPQGEAQIVGFMDSATLRALAETRPEIDLQSTSIAVLDRKTIKLTGQHKAAKPDAAGTGRRAKGSPLQVWPDEWINSLPEHLRNYRAVLWDKKAGSLVVVPQGTFNRALPKIVIRLNQSSKSGVTASVVSLGSSDAGSLSNPDLFELLVGSLDAP
jgi:SPP1 gp7 family putative phage head morphogenesis protein